MILIRIYIGKRGLRKESTLGSMKSPRVLKARACECRVQGVGFPTVFLGVSFCLFRVS